MTDVGERLARLFDKYLPSKFLELILTTPKYQYELTRASRHFGVIRINSRYFGVTRGTYNGFDNLQLLRGHRHGMRKIDVLRSDSWQFASSTYLELPPSPSD